MSGLNYSPSIDLVNCFSLQTYASGQGKSRCDQAFVLIEFNNLKNTIENFRENQKSFSYEEDCMKVVSFKSSQVNGSIDSKVYKKHEMIALKIESI